MLESMLKYEDWSWPPARSKEIQSKLALVQIGDVHKPEWVVSKKRVYFCAET